MKAKIDWRAFLLLPLPLLWGWLAQGGYLQGAENYLLDWRFRLRGAITAPIKVHYVDVDTRAIQAIGERPWNRASFAQAALLLLEQGGARTVGFDLVFSALGHSQLVNNDDATAGNLALGRAGRKHPEIILAGQYTSGDATLQQGAREFPLLYRGHTDREKNDIPELPQYPIMGSTLTSSWGTIGLIDIDYAFGGDESPRWAALFAETPVPTYWHMGLQLTCAALGVPVNSIRRNGDHLEIFAPDGRVLRRIPATAQQLLQINWFSQWDDADLNPHTSLADVLTAGAMLESEKESDRAEAADYFKRFAGAVVLVGPTDVLLQDLAVTPFDRFPVPKVSAHGNLVKTIMAERYLYRPPLWVMWACVFGLTGGVAGLAVSSGSRGLLTKVLAVVLLVGFGLVAIYLFSQFDWVLPMAAPVGAAFSTSFIATVWQLIVEEKQKGRIKGMFSAYLAPAVVNSLIESGKEPELGGHKAVITAYFSDIQSFSSFSEQMPASQLVELMNEYLTVCTDTIQEEGGTLDKYIGDAVVAMFGDPLPLPDHAFRACTATIRAQKKIVELRAKWKSEGAKWPSVVHVLRARLGLNTGDAIIGNMGSRNRFSYTMMGDNVNLAARMESGAKLIGVYTMVTDTTRAECEKHAGDKIVFRFLDKIIVKGRTHPVSVHEVVGFKSEVDQRTFDCLGLHARATERYLLQDWAGAIQLFEDSAKLELFQPSKELAIDSNPSLQMIKRCHYMQEHPPGKDWAGVFEMKEKG